MQSIRRFDPLDFDVVHDEELPDYEPTTAPQYSREDYDAPLHTYHLRQVYRKLQVFVPYGPSAVASYKVTSRGARLFSKKPEMDITRIRSEDASEEPVAGIWFDADGPLPWRPRAHFSYMGSQGMTTHDMESRNFQDWTVAIGGTTYIWALETRPASLVLTEKGTTEVIARFSFSAQGTLASSGAEVGDLFVYHHPLFADTGSEEKIMCGLVVSIGHFRKMGRYYRNGANDSPIRSSSLAGEFLASHRASVATYATL